MNVFAGARTSIQKTKGSAPTNFSLSIDVRHDPFIQRDSIDRIDATW